MEMTGMRTSTRVAIGITVVVLSIGYKFWRATGGGFGRGGGADVHETAEAVDETCAEMLAAPNHREAREWCKDPRSAGFEMSREDMGRLAETFYKAGAERVFVTDIEPMGGSNVSASMVVVLPKDSSARKGVFETEAKFAEQAGEEAVRDVGQKYVLLSLD